MAILSFSLTPDATAKIHEILLCLAKFGENVALEVKQGKLTITALNLSRTAFASIALDARAFFISYEFRKREAIKGGDRFTCQLLNRALQSVFKGRMGEARGREGPVERCDVSIQDQPDETECRLIVKMICKHGMTKAYRLTYETVEVMHALFDRGAAAQSWKIRSRVLREYVEYFGPKTEQLDLLASDGKAVFTSFTEKIADGKEVLKQPLETAIAIHTEDFEDFHVQEGMHIVISVKDFKAIVTHAETLKATISAHFSFPTRPLQFSYQNSGVHCEFTLMTTGDYRAASSTPIPNFVTTRSSSRQPSIARVAAPSRSVSEMPPPARPTVTLPHPSNQSQRPPLSQLSQRPSLSQSFRSARVEAPDPDPESLFVPGDDDQVWNPPEYENEEEEMLGWDASNEDPRASFHPTFTDSSTVASKNKTTQASAHASQGGIEPTQRLSQLHGMFD